MLPSSLAYDASGTLYIAVTGAQVVESLSPQGEVHTVAGNGIQGYAGDSGPATAAMLDSPAAIAFDPAGNLFIADTHNHRIRRVDVASGIISTYVLTQKPLALVFNDRGELVFADGALHQVLTVNPVTGLASVIAGSGMQGFAGDGGAAIQAALDSPAGLAFNDAGALYIADAHNHRIRRVDPLTGQISTVAGTGKPGFSGDQVLAAATQLNLPRGLSVDLAGNLYIADSANQRIRRIDATTGLITTVAGSGTQGFAGDGSAATSAALDTPRSVTISPIQLPTVADTANARIRLLDAGANIQTVAGVGAIVPAGASSATTLVQVSASTLLATVSVSSGSASGMATLIDGARPLAAAALSAGRAAFVTGLLSTGSHTLTALYTGNSGQLSSVSQPLILTIGNPSASDFTLAAIAPLTVTTSRGGAAVFSFEVALTGAPLSSPINLSVDGAPRGSTPSFSPAIVPPLSGPAAFTLTIVTPPAIALDHGSAGAEVAGIAMAAFLIPLSLRRRRCGAWLLLLVGLTGCGARINSDNSGRPPPIMYNVTVTAAATSPTGGSLLHTVPVTLVVD